MGRLTLDPGLKETRTGGHANRPKPRGCGGSLRAAFDSYNVSGPSPRCGGRSARSSWETAAPRIPVAGERRPGGGCQITARKLQGSKSRSVSFAEGKAVPLAIHSIPSRPCQAMPLPRTAQPRSRAASTPPRQLQMRRSRAERIRRQSFDLATPVRLDLGIVFDPHEIEMRLCEHQLQHRRNGFRSIRHRRSSSPCASSGRRMPMIAPLPDARQTHVHLLAPAARRQ